MAPTQIEIHSSSSLKWPVRFAEAGPAISLATGECIPFELGPLAAPEYVRCHVEDGIVTEYLAPSDMGFIKRQSTSVQTKP